MKNKKGVSIIIGYVILVSFLIVLAIIVYSWMKTYVPMEELNCPDGVSIFIEKYTYSPDQLTLYLKNNGKFNIGGYFIYATTSPNQIIATTDLSRNITGGTLALGSVIKLGEATPGNLFAPNEKETEIYNLIGLNKIYSIEILPIRWQEKNNKKRLVSCKDAKIRETIIYKVTEEECTPESTEITCGSAVCGTKKNNCGDDITCPPNDCGTGFFCDAEGQCISSSCTPASDPCGTFICGTAQNGTCGVANCGTPCDLINALSDCPTGLSCIVSSCIDGWCNSDGIDSNGCEVQLGTNLNCASCGDVCTTGTEICSGGSCTSCNGIWISPEDSGIGCDGTPLPAHCLANCTCGGGYVSNGTGGCKIPDSVQSCQAYCSFMGYTGTPGVGSCRQNQAQCNSYCDTDPGVLESGGNPWCVSPTTNCCCCPPKS